MEEAEFSRADKIRFSTSKGTYLTSTWHKIQCHFCLHKTHILQDRKWKVSKGQSLVFDRDPRGPATGLVAFLHSAYLINKSVVFITFAQQLLGLKCMWGLLVAPNAIIMPPLDRRRRFAAVQQPRALAKLLFLLSSALLVALFVHKFFFYVYRAYDLVQPPWPSKPANMVEYEQIASSHYYRPKILCWISTYPRNRLVGFCFRLPVAANA